MTYICPNEPKYEGDVTYTCRFRGNTLAEISPPLLPKSLLYQDRAEKYKVTKVPLKKVTRYVSPNVLQW